MAISLTRVQVAEKAWNRANPTWDEEANGLSVPDVEQMIDEAVKKLCDLIAQTPRYRRLQVTTSALSLSSGQATLPDNVMPDTLTDDRGGRVMSSALTYPLNYLPNITDLKYPQPGGAEVGFFHVQGGNSSGGIVYCSLGTGANLTGTITVIACAYQTFSTLAPEFEDDLIEVLADMAREKMAGMRRQ